jgi:hypothetical protein
MTILNHLAQAAAIILILELMVVLLVFLGVAGGLAFGFRWVNGKSGTGFKLAREYSQKAAKYVHEGTGFAALPVIKVRRFGETVGVTAEAVKRQVRRIETVRSRDVPVPAAEPIPEPAVGARPAGSP